MRRSRALAILAIAIGAAVGIGVWLKGRREERGEPAPAAEVEVARGARSSGGPVAAPVPARPIPGGTASAPASDPRAGTRGKSALRILCDFGPVSRCQRGRGLAGPCDGGDAAACGALAMLYLEPPVQPTFARHLSAWACTLGDEPSCEREDRHVGYEQWPNGRPGDPSPADACDRGDPAACDVLLVKAASQEGVDEDAARRGCAIGMADACATLALVARDGAEVVAQLGRACELGAPHHCAYLIEIFDRQRGCCGRTDDDACVACPPPDAARAAHYRQRYREIAGRPYQPVGE